ncbi:MAG: ATP-binding protein [Alphaproteobacteria bacterium]|nr:ATP-binding protein [Alphaproteobacteria bacterium]
MKKLINLKAFKNMLRNKENSSPKIALKIAKNKSDSVLSDIKLVNVIDTPFIVLKANNSISFINNAAKTKFKLNNYSNIFHNFRRPEFRDNIVKFRKMNKDSHGFLLELFNVPLTMFFEVKMYKLHSGNILLSFIDITRIQKLENIRSDFIGNVSHELKTPLSTIMNIIELFHDQKSMQTNEQKKFLDILKKESGKMKLIIEDLLQLTKIETDSNKKIIKTVDLNKIIKDSIQSISTTAKKNGIKIKFKKIQIANIKGDKNQLHQMFVNILDNSIKYSQKNSDVFIQLRNTENRYILSFKDKGKGIPHTLIPRITERFYRVPSNKIENIEGTGLGLAIVKHIALRHDAKLNITSKVGVGTNIEIIFKKSINTTRLDL